MKKQKVSEFVKGNSFYLVLLTGICAVIAIALVYTNIVPSKSNDGLIDLNETIPEVASKENNFTEIVGNEIGAEFSEANNNINLEESRIVKEDVIAKDNAVDQNDFATSKTTEDEALQTSTSSVATSTENIVDQVIDTKTVPVVKSNQNKKESFNFKEEDGLIWPVSGNVLMNYSMDHSIYFQTLGQYKVNPAIILDGEVGTKVLSAAKGVVSEISTNEETGLTITTSIGNGYSLVYGQIDSAQVKVGDTVLEGETIGCIAEPTKYYVVEGSNLFFQVFKDDKTINPMVLLK